MAGQTTKRARARVSRRQRQLTGKGVERYVLECAKRDPEQRVHIVRIPDPVVITSRQGRVVKGHLDQKRTVDYLGWLRCTAFAGRALGVECKETEQVKWKLDSRLRTHQLPHLVSLATDGGVACVYVRSLGRVSSKQRLRQADYLIPVTSSGLACDDSGDNSRASFHWSELDRWRLGPRSSWIDAVVAWEDYCAGGWAGLVPK